MVASLLTVILSLQVPATPVQDHYGASFRPLTVAEKQTIDAEFDLYERLAKQYAATRFATVAKWGDAAILETDGSPSVSNGQAFNRARLGNLVGRAALRAGNRPLAIRTLRWARTNGDQSELGNVLQGFDELDRGDLDALRTRVAAFPPNVYSIPSIFADYAPGLRSRADLELRLNLAGDNACGWSDEPLSQSFVERAVRVAPKNPYVLFLMSKVRSRQGRLKDSVAYLTRAYDLSEGTTRNVVGMTLRGVLEWMDEAARTAKKPASKSGL